MSLPKYPKYKDSGVEWLGEVAEHWGAVRLKNFASTNMGQSPNSEDCNQDGEGVPFLQGNADFGDVFPSPRHYCLVANKLAQPNDILLSVRAPVGAINVADQIYGIGRGLCAITPAAGNSQRYLLHALEVIKRELFSVATGSTYEAVSIEQIGNAKCLCPPREEQNSIAVFLDSETSKIDNLIAEQEKLIALLTEKRQAVISLAVTKGLNPKAKMKDSRVEWLGEVPEHWDVKRLKGVASVCGRIGYRGYKSEDLVGEDEGALVLGGTNLTSRGQLDLSKRTYLSWSKYEESPEIKVALNDLVIGQRGTCGSVVLVDREIGPATINPSLVVLKHLKIDSRFLCYWLMGDLIQNLFASYLNSTAIPMLTQEQIGNVPVCHPPIEEQKSIANYIEVEAAKLDILTTEAKCAVELLQERRIALISAAVTGKIDVRGIHN